MRFADTLAAAVLSTNSDAIIAADKEGIIRFWNPARSAFSAMRATPPSANHWTSSFRNDCESAIGTAIDQSSRAARAVTAMATSSRFPASKRTARRVSIEFTIMPLRDGTGALTGLAAIMRDVTKRFEEMRALKQKLAEATKASR